MTIPIVQLIALTALTALAGPALAFDDVQSATDAFEFDGSTEDTGAPCSDCDITTEAQECFSRGNNDERELAYQNRLTSETQYQTAKIQLDAAVDGSTCDCIEDPESEGTPDCTGTALVEVSVAVLELTAGQMEMSKFGLTDGTDPTQPTTAHGAGPNGPDLTTDPTTATTGSVPISAFENVAARVYRATAYDEISCEAGVNALRFYLHELPSSPPGGPPIEEIEAEELNDGFQSPTDGDGKTRHAMVEVEITVTDGDEACDNTSEVTALRYLEWKPSFEFKPQYATDLQKITPAGTSDSRHNIGRPRDCDSDDGKLPAKGF